MKKENIQKIKLLKEAIKTNQKRINNFMLASEFTNKYNHRILEMYEMIACWEKIIINLRMEQVRIVLNNRKES